MKDLIITYILSLLSLATLIFFINKYINFRLKEKVNSERSDLSINILKGFVILSASILFNSMINNYLALIKVLPSSILDADVLQNALSYYSLYFIILVSMTFLCISLSSILYSIINLKKSVFFDSANNNIEGVLLFGGILIGITLISNQLLNSAYELLIPYPQIPIYR
jgi:hypothetical protein